MKLFSISSSINPRVYSFHVKIQQRLLATAPSGIILPKKPSLYSRISPLGDPNVSLSPVLDQWIIEGNSPYKGEIRRVIKELMLYRRFKHALEVSLWMTNKQRFPMSPFDVCVRLKLINKVFGLEKVENYFSKIPENLKQFNVYLALLNCYTVAKSVDKAESIMQKAKDLGFVTKPVWYNLMMNLYCQLGNRKKMYELLAEMKSKGIAHDQFTYSICVTACAMASDVEKMDEIVMMMMKSDQGCNIQWQTYVNAIKGYLKMGFTDKALMILSKLEEQSEPSKRNWVLFAFLLNLYADAGKKDEVYRIWNLCKQRGKIVNKVYISMMRSLMKFDDIEGVENIFEEWESSGLFVDFRVHNFLIDAYCADGLVEKAEALITKGISKGGERLVSTWCHLARGYLKMDQMPKAVDALKEAILICPPNSVSEKDSLTTCLKYLENKDSIGKAEELIKLISTKRSLSTFSNDLCGFKDADLESFPEDINSTGICLPEDENR